MSQNDIPEEIRNMTFDDFAKNKAERIFRGKAFFPKVEFRELLNQCPKCGQLPSVCKMMGCIPPSDAEPKTDEPPVCQHLDTRDFPCDGGFTERCLECGEEVI